MSKMDNLRAMREARYAENAARAKSPASTTSPKRTSKPTAAATATTAPRPMPSAPVEGDDAVETEELCGHKNMGGRTCTREKGHSAKSHRYS